MQEFIDFLPALNTITDAIVLVLMFGILAACIWMQKKKFVSSKSPEAIYNRSVAWYQNIMAMPVAERAQELEQWANYTKKLPHPKNDVKIMDC
ncbi:hypothetical protein [Alteromonas sp. a30]|uniref:hypothetical protein n=1 Tax=Alteromonas sp. a30 TaxID=2730917 RepID=UPI00228206A5|nr:hypothetical protein [Alteromonas sp. a30]MCY7297405.1 hypothetical protein [Alteromonas sp. a30]